MEDQPRPAVVVTGASAGLGRAFARNAAEDGGPVVLIARTQAALEDAAAEVRQGGGEPLVLPLDLMRDGAAAQVEQYLAEHELFCAVLVNSAGLGIHGAACALPPESQLSIVDLNIRALTSLTLRFLPGMVARGSGGVINLGSAASFVPGPYMALYYASKAFVCSFSEALWEETRNTGVTVTCVVPGPVKTGFFATAGASRARLFKLLPRLTADRVARAGWRDFRAGRRLSTPGATARLAATLAGCLPHALTLPVLARLQQENVRPHQE